VSSSLKECNILSLLRLLLYSKAFTFHDTRKWVPVTTAWRCLSLRMKERTPLWRVAANILKKQSRTANKGCSTSFAFGWGANNSSPQKSYLVTKCSHRKPRRPGLWLRIGKGGGLFWMRQRTFGFNKMRGISWLTENRLASQEGPCAME